MLTMIQAELETMLADLHTEDEGAMNTQFVLLAGVGAVIAIALGFILFGSVTGAGNSIDNDFTQISN